MKIRAQLALIATAALIPVIIFSAVVLNLLLDAERTAALRGLQEKARSIALMVDQELGSAEAALRVLANSDRLASGDLRSFYGQAKAFGTSSSSWTLLFDERGEQAFNTIVPFGAALKPVPQATRERVQTVMNTARPVVSDLLVGPLTGRFLTTINVPVPVGGGRRFVLAQVFSADHFTPIFGRNNVPPDWTVGIIDRQGKFIARNLNAEKLIGQRAHPALLAAIDNATDGQVRHDTLEGVDSYDVFTRSTLTGWTVAVAVPANLVESTARRAVMLTAFGLLAAILAAAGTAALVSRRLVTALRGLDWAGAALARGEAPAAVKTGVAEMDRLGTSLCSAGAILMQEKQSRQIAEAERARLLENERLARHNAEVQNKQKDQFLAMLGHELRNPLSAISGAIAVMKARDASAALNVRAHTIIERQSNHLSHIVDDLLDLSRMSMGKIKLDKQCVDLAAVVHASVETLYAAGRVGRCDIGIESEPVWIDADRTRLDQIIGNVIGNALKFSSLQGRIDITVARDRDEAGDISKDEAVWTVRDFGIGISEELMPNIFDAFVQGAAQADHALGGLGIGLNLVRQLVKLHGGSINITSEGTGTGTMVEVRFPVSASVEPNLAENSTSSTSATAAASATPPTLPAAAPNPPAMSTVLLIEDNADSREMMSMLLGMLGYQVLEAANGGDGLKLAHREQPAIAVVDIGLPDLDGYEIARQLRADDVLKNMTLIALTGYGQDADRKRALDAGFDSHLVKPLNMDVLVNTIVSHQAKQRSHPHGS
ncbi:MAG: ATP-binding protein [Pseudomonadota bacterium]